MKHMSKHSYNAACACLVHFWALLSIRAPPDTLLPEALPWGWGPTPQKVLPVHKGMPVHSYCETSTQHCCS